MTRNLPTRISRIAGAAAASPSDRDPALAERDQPLGLQPPVERKPAAPRELSAREREVLCWAQQGKTYWEIGCILGISQRTVKFHIQRIKSKLDVVSTAHAIAQAMRRGIIT